MWHKCGIYIRNRSAVPRDGCLQSFRNGGRLKKYYSIDAAREAIGLFDVKERHLAGGDMGGVVRMTSDGWITWTLSDADGGDDDFLGG